MGLREWTESRLNGSTKDEAIGRLSKMGVEVVFSIETTLVWSLPTWVVATVLVPSADASFQVGPATVTMSQVDDGVLLLASVLWFAYIRYENGIYCSYP